MATHEVEWAMRTAKLSHEECQYVIGVLLGNLVFYAGEEEAGRLFSDAIRYAGKLVGG